MVYTLRFFFSLKCSLFHNILPDDAQYTGTVTLRMGCDSHIFTENDKYMIRILEFTDEILYINKIQQDATVWRCLFTAKLLYMFRVSIAPIISST